MHLSGLQYVLLLYRTTIRYCSQGRKPLWWVVLGDDKSNRIVVPPFKITDIPFSNADSDRDYRSYKIQFQGPPSTGLFTWRVYLVSDTFVGEEVVKDITVRSFPLLMYGMIPDMGFFVTVEI